MDEPDPALKPVSQDQLSRLYVLVESIGRAMARTNSFFGEALVEELQYFREAGTTQEFEWNLDQLIATVRTWGIDRLE